MITIVLVEPQTPGNVGSVCRAMKNFGFSKLVLVRPCKLTGEAGMMAVHAKDILEKTKTVKKIPKFDYMIGTTAIRTERDDYFVRMTTPLKELREKIKGKKGNVGVLFGTEADGLPNDVLEECDIVTNIPTSAKYHSMNLSHAVSVVLYELSNIRQNADVRLASARENKIIKESINSMMERINYPEEKRKVFNSMIRKVLGRAVVTGREANTLIGVLKKINKGLK